MREPASRGNEWLVPSGPQFPYSVRLVSPSHVESPVPGTVMKWKKQSGILKHFSPNAGLTCADVVRQHQTHGINTHTNILRSPSFHQDFLFLSCMTRWNRETILIVFTSLTQVGNKQQSRHARISWTVEILFFFGNSSISFFNLIFCIFSFPCKAFKGKCSSTDKQVARFSRKNKHLLLRMIKNTGQPNPYTTPLFGTKCFGSKDKPGIIEDKSATGTFEDQLRCFRNSMQFPVFSL